MPIQFWNTPKAIYTAPVASPDRPGLVRSIQQADGTFVYCWVLNDTNSDGEGDVFFQRTDINGNLIGLPTLVANTGDGAGSVDADYFKMEALPTGGFVVSWLDYDTGNLSFVKYNAAGVQVGGVFDVAPGVGASPSPNDHVMTVNSLGDVVIASQITVDLGGVLTSTVYYSLFSPTYGNFTFAGLTTADPTYVTAPAVAMLSDTQILTAVASGGQIQIGTFDLTTGLPFYTYFDSTTIPNSVDPSLSAPTITRLADGSFLLTYPREFSAAAGTDIAGVILDANGNAYTTPFKINSQTVGEQLLYGVEALDNGGFVCVYSSASNTKYYVEMFNADGSHNGGPVLLNTSSSIVFVETTILSDDRILVTWNDSGTGQLMSQIIDPREGYFVGTENADRIQGSNGGNDYLVGLGGNDTILGLRGNDTIFGDAGNDILDGGLGDDEIYGGDGNDTLYGGKGADKIYGDAGTDNVSYSASAGAVNVNLTTLQCTGGDAEGDELFSIETLIGTNNATTGDVLTGDSLANTLYGLIGNDTLMGMGGNDTLIGGAGGDVLNGGDATDLASYITSVLGVTVSLEGAGSASGGDATGDTLISIENLAGSNTAGDTLTGSSIANVINGNGGSDFLNGRLGNDTLIGGTGADFFVFDTALNASTNRDTISDFVVADDTIQLENAIFTQLAVTGFLASNLFRNTTLNPGVDLDDRILYNDATGEIFYDSDGSGANAAVLFAVLTGSPTITEADFLVV